MKKQKQGKVISDRMQSTVIVETMSLVSHPMYRKTLKQKSKFIAHNPDNKAKMGDMVRIVETRPLSKMKRWKVVEVIRTAESGLVDDAKKRALAVKKSKKKGAK